MGGEGASQVGRLHFSRNHSGCAVAIALVLWIFAGDYVNPTTAALVVISLMVRLNVMTWDDITKNFNAWNTLAWFATLVALADGLNRVGFVKWFANLVSSHMGGFSPVTAMIVLLLINFFAHYMFASVTAHVTALIPVLLAVGSAVPNMNMPQLALLLCLQLGIMGIITPYGTGPESGLLRQRLSACGGLLATRRHLWIDLSRRIYADHGALGARRRLIKNRGNNDSRTLSSILPGIDLGTVDDFGGGLAIKSRVPRLFWDQSRGILRNPSTAVLVTAHPPFQPRG